MKITTIGRFGAYPQKGEATSGYLLQTESHNILIDCGSGVLSLVQDYISLDEIDSVIISHYHGDHIADIFCLQYAALLSMKLQKRKEAINIYGYSKDPSFEKLTYGDCAKGVAIDESSIIAFGDLRVSFLWTQHPQPCLAMKFQQGDKSFVYTGDTGLFDGLIEFCKDTDVLISECSLYNEYKGAVEGHLAAGEAGELAQRANVGRLVLSHLPGYGELDLLVSQAREQFDGEVILNEKGLVLSI